MSESINPATVLAALRKHHQGKDKAGHMATLVWHVTYKRADANSERQTRLAIEQLRLDGHPVCALPSAGYFLAQTADEIAETVGFLRGRALTSLRLAASLQRVSVPQLLGQMAIESLDELQPH